MSAVRCAQSAMAYHHLHLSSSRGAGPTEGPTQKQRGATQKQRGPTEEARERQRHQICKINDLITDYGQQRAPCASQSDVELNMLGGSDHKMQTMRLSSCKKCGLVRCCLLQSLPRPMTGWMLLTSLLIPHNAHRRCIAMHCALPHNTIAIHCFALQVYLITVNTSWLFNWSPNHFLSPSQAELKICKSTVPYPETQIDY